MKKNRSFQSGFITKRNLFGVVLCVAGISFTMLSFGAKPATQKHGATQKQSTNERLSVQATTPAGISPTSPGPSAPSPTSGTLSTSNRTLTYTDPTGPVPNATGEGVGFSKPTCAANGVDCSNYIVTLDPSVFAAAPGYDPTKYNIVIALQWSPSVNQYGSFVEDKNGNVIASNTAGGSE